jgi:c-di-GMP-binding flagellar brake protein YcgR
MTEASGRGAAMVDRSVLHASRAAWGISQPVGVQEKRRRRRVSVPSMYTSATLRNLARRTGPVEAYVVDISENGMAIEADSLIPVGQAVTIEFQVAGLGPARRDAWPEFAAAAEVVRHDNVEDFPGGPYRMALRFVKISTMAQAQIARYVATQPG